MEKGYSFAQLSNGETTPEDRTLVMDVERVTGAMTSVVKGTARVEEVIEALRNMYQAEGKPLPSWLTIEMLRGATARFHQVWGHWNSLRFGEMLGLDFDVT